MSYISSGSHTKYTHNGGGMDVVMEEDDDNMRRSSQKHKNRSGSRNANGAVRNNSTGSSTERGDKSKLKSRDGHSRSRSRDV